MLCLPDAGVANISFTHCSTTQVALPEASPFIFENMSNEFLQAELRRIKKRQRESKVRVRMAKGCNDSSWRGWGVDWRCLFLVEMESQELT